MATLGPTQHVAPEPTSEVRRGAPGLTWNVRSDHWPTLHASLIWHVFGEGGSAGIQNFDNGEWGGRK